MDYHTVPTDIHSVPTDDDDDEDASVSLESSDFNCSEDEEDLVVIDSIDCDEMIVPDEMDLFIQLPEITQSRVSDWAGIVRVEVVAHDQRQYIIIDDDVDSGDDLVDILTDDPNSLLIDLTVLDESSDEDSDAL